MAVSAERFLQYLEREKRYSSHTIIAYRNDLTQFLNYLYQQYGINDLTAANAPMIRSWLAQSISEGLSKTTVKRKISAYKSFLRFAQKNEPTIKNPFDKITSIKKSKVLPAFIEQEGMNRLFDQTEFKEDFSGKRDRLILSLFYTTGMRLSELCQLQHQHFDASNNTITVTGKRAKQRIIPLLPEVGVDIINYFAEKEKRFGLELDSHIFISDKGNKIYPKFVYRLVTHYLGKITTRSRKGPHILRHTFATHMLNNGADLNAIKEILGHANLSATQVYTHNSIEKLKTVYKQAHPKA